MLPQSLTWKLGCHCAPQASFIPLELGRSVSVPWEGFPHVGHAWSICFSSHFWSFAVRTSVHHPSSSVYILTFVTTLTLKTMRTVAMPESDAFEGAVFKCTQHLPFGAMSIQFNPITYKQRSLQFHIHGVYSCYSEYTRILSTHTDTQWHTLHIDVGVYIHIYIWISRCKNRHASRTSHTNRSRYSSLATKRLWTEESLLADADCSCFVCSLRTFLAPEVGGNANTSGANKVWQMKCKWPDLTNTIHVDNITHTDEIPIAESPQRGNEPLDEGHAATNTVKP